MSRQSSKGNPYHYPAGTPKGGQFAPKGFQDAAVSVCGHYFADREAFAAYEGDIEKESRAYYEDRTRSRFLGGEATEGQKKLATSIEKQLGVPAPEDGTARDYEDYIQRNIYDYGAATEGQARTIKKLEDLHGVTLASDDRYGSSAGSFIGHCKAAEAVLDDRNWEKADDGCYYCRNLEWNEDGSPAIAKTGKNKGRQKGSDTGYRMRPVRVNGKTRYVIERRSQMGEQTIDGKKVKVYAYKPIESDKTGLKSLVKDDRGAAMKRASLNELKRHTVSGRTATKKSPKGIGATVKAFERMGDKDNWVSHKGGLEYGHSYDGNNSYKYRIEQGTTGLHVYREVVSSQERSEFDSKSGKMVKRRYSHKRTEWVATGCQSESEAITAAKKHEANSITKQRINIKAASDKDIQRWKAKGWIKSKKEYEQMLDPVKDYLAKF